MAGDNYYWVRFGGESQPASQTSPGFAAIDDFWNFLFDLSGSDQVERVAR
jgi:hypothetical protein